MSTLSEYSLLCAAAAVGGAINSVAGGGTLLTFPALDSVLGSSVLANGTSTISLCPGSIAGAWGYRKELEGSKHWIRLLVLPSLFGGLLGTLLVVLMDESYFEAAVPWLILTAAVLFLVQPAIARWTGIGKPHEAPSAGARFGVIVFQFFVALYGGYFGAGIGILMLSGLALMGLADIHRMNALKTLFASCINGMAVGVFIYTGKIVWEYAAVMIVSGILGGYVGARVARKLDRNVVRGIVVTIGFSLAAYYFFIAESAPPTPATDG